MATDNDHYDQTIKAITLDNYFKGKESSISIIRVDAEGSECRVLRGAKNIIDSSPDIRLFIEWQPALLKKYETTDSLTECLGGLLDKGFIFLDIAEFNRNCDYKNYQLSIVDIMDNPVLEVLAIKKNTLQEFIRTDYLSNDIEECLVGINNLLYSSVERNSLESIKYALSQGADIEYMSKKGTTSLYWAAQEGRLEITRELSKAGANLGVIAPNKMTPLTISIQNNDSKMVGLQAYTQSGGT